MTVEHLRRSVGWPYEYSRAASSTISTPPAYCSSQTARQSSELHRHSPQDWMWLQTQLDSLHGLAKNALSLRGLVLSTYALTGPGTQTILADGQCGNSPLSCHNSSYVEDLCCFNAPGGTLLLTQFWDAAPATGPVDSWTLHGLWPDNCDGTYEAYCDDERNYRNITGILLDSGREDTLAFMQKYWKDYKGNDEVFWQHEWGKHGTCVSTLEPSCFPTYAKTAEVGPFFDRAVELFKALPTYEWLTEAGITPSRTARYTSEQIQSALTKHFGYEVRLGCHYGQLNEVWYFYNVRGSVQAGDFMPTDMIGSRSTCPSTGIRWLPKDNGPKPTTTHGPAPTSKPIPGSPFIGRGSLHVVRSGGTKGCIISAGTWYTSGTCATFVATKDIEDSDSFTLKSSKGYCGVFDNELICGRGAKASLFQASDSKLVYNGSDNWYADKVPKGRMRSKIFTDPDHDEVVKLKWSH